MKPYLKRVLFLSCFLIAVKSAYNQAISFPELFQLLDTEPSAMDTVMKKMHYNLLQKETDSTSFQYYYNNVERGGEGVPSWVRSLTYAQVSTKSISSRLITYRTYRKKEYQDLMSWLLNNNFHTKKTYDFDKEKHTLFSDGVKTVLLKVGPKPLPDGRKILTYELELGK